MANCRNKEEKDKIIKRLKRIEGQIRGIENMISQDKECIEILRQVNSITGAVHGVWVQLLNDHLKTCITNALVKKDKKLVDELIEHLKKVR